MKYYIDCEHDYEYDDRFKRLLFTVLFNIIPGYRPVKCKKCGDETSFCFYNYD